MISESTWRRLEQLGRGEITFTQFARFTAPYWDRIARRLAQKHRVESSSCGVEDVRQMLLIGVWESTLGYDPARGAYPSYAYKLAVLRAEKRIDQCLRRRDSTHPPRDVMRLSSSIDAEPDDDELRKPLTLVSSSDPYRYSELALHSRSHACSRPGIEQRILHLALDRARFDADVAVSLIIADRTLTRSPTRARRLVHDYISALVAS